MFGTALLISMSLAPAIPVLDDDHVADALPRDRSDPLVGAVVAAGSVGCVACVGGAVGLGAVLTGGGAAAPCVVAGPVGAVAVAFVDEAVVHDGVNGRGLAHGAFIVGGYVGGAVAFGVPAGAVGYGSITDVSPFYGAAVFGIPAALVGGSIGAAVVAGVLAYGDLDPAGR